MDLNSAVSYYSVSNTDNTESRPQGEFPEIPTLGSFTLEQILQYHSRVVDVLGKHEARERALSNKTTFLGLLETTHKLLRLFIAAKTTYFDKKYSHSDLELNVSDSSIVCLRSPISIGRQTLQEEDGDVISRTVIKSSVIQLVNEIADLKGWFQQFGNRSDLVGHIDRDFLEMGELERLITNIWAFVAGTKE